MKRSERLLRISLAAIAGSLVVALAGLWRVTAVTSLALFVLGTPLFVAGVAGYLIVVWRDLKAHGVW